jgi:CRISPR-associated exonuclease Cas4
MVLALSLTLALGILLYVLSSSLAQTTGLPANARILSSDVGAADPPLLEDPALGIRGRPDYVIREAKGLVPVEVKPTRASTQLYQSDLIQLAAYLLLVRAVYPTQFAGYGRVQYRHAQFVVELTPELEARCRATAHLVRAARQATTVHRTHSLAVKCRACAMRPFCDEALPAIE